MSNRILIVEDDPQISELLSGFLQQNGCETITAADGDTASLLLKKQNYDIVLMDLMLPKRSGEELIRELRRYSEAPVIVISARSMLETRLEMLRIGADDYILKPFDLNEVLVRIQVVLRRSGTASSDVISCGGLTLNSADKCVAYNGDAIALTAKELMLLQLFMEHPKKVYSKANLYESVWNDTYYYEDNTVNVHVSNLRSKLKKASGRDFIETVWGIGYRLREEQE